MNFFTAPLVKLLDLNCYIYFIVDIKPGH